MSPNEEYVFDVLKRHQTLSSVIVARVVVDILRPSINTYAHQFLDGVYIAGSIAKGTAISSNSDVDILISIKDTASETLNEIYETLFNRLITDGYYPRRQNVSLGLSVNGWKVDVVPAKKHSAWSNNHSIWSNKHQTHRETNIHEHVKYVTESNRLNEIKLLKIWRNLHKLEFPSFLLEVTVITALRGYGFNNVAENFVKVLEYIRDNIQNARIIDPTKPSNILSDELSNSEKLTLSQAAINSLGGRWNQALW